MVSNRFRIVFIMILPSVEMTYGFFTPYSTGLMLMILYVTLNKK